MLESEATKDEWNVIEMGWFVYAAEETIWTLTVSDLNCDIIIGRTALWRHCDDNVLRAALRSNFYE
jgi:hypothetical protein